MALDVQAEIQKIKDWGEHVRTELARQSTIVVNPIEPAAEAPAEASVETPAEPEAPAA